MTLVERVARELRRFNYSTTFDAGASPEGKKLYLREARRIVKMFQEDSVITRFRKLKSGKLVLKEGKA